jgi:hypothetical protein
VKATSLRGGDSLIRVTSSGTVRVGLGRRRGENRFRCEDTVLLSPATKESVEDCGGGRWLKMKSGKVVSAVGECRSAREHPSLRPKEDTASRLWDETMLVGVVLLWGRERRYCESVWLGPRSDRTMTWN